MKKVLMVRHLGSVGSPVYERSNSFNEYFKKCGFTVEARDTPTNILSLLKLIKVIISIRPDYLFITMPPFRNWSLCLLPFTKVILDIRDGWSVSMKGGYGGLVKPSPKKAIIARFIEFIAIKSCYATITCTPGLQKYFKALSRKEIYLVRNGVSASDFEMAKIYRKPLNFVDKETSKKIRKFVCAGKFSEYGKEKVKQVVQVINERYGDSSCVIKLIGSNINENAWLEDYIEMNGLVNLRVEFSDRLDKNNMYKEMSDAFCAVTIIRDPSYDFGTKIYDYLALNLKYLDYFDERNEFNDYFGEYSDLNNTYITNPIKIKREEILFESDFHHFFKDE